MTNYAMQSFSQLPDAELAPLEESKIEVSRAITSRKGYRGGVGEVAEDPGMPGNVLVTNIHEGGDDGGPQGGLTGARRGFEHEHQPLGVKMQFSLPYTYYFTSCQAEVLHGSLGRAAPSRSDSVDEGAGSQSSRAPLNDSGIETVGEKKKIQGVAEYQRDKEYLYVVLGDSRGFLHICNIFGIDGENRRTERVYMQSAR